MLTPRRFPAAVIKHGIWCLLRPWHDSDAWPMTVLSGPAKGATLVLDIRRNGAYWLGTYDRWIVDRIVLPDWVPVGGVAWDCGSYVGYYAALLRRCVGDQGQVFAFEASRRNFERLRPVPDLNGWKNVHVVRLAIGAEHSELQFAGALEGSSGPIGLAKTYEGAPLSERVTCSGVDELCYERDVPLPDFIKFDIESAEEFALHTGKRVFSEQRPTLLLEWHGSRVLAAVGRFLADYDYLAWDVLQFDRPDAEPLVDVLTVERAVADMSNTLVCVPREKAARRARVRIGIARAMRRVAS